MKKEGYTTMAHPNGGMGNIFKTKHSFSQAYAHIGAKGIKFTSTTGEQISATQGIARDGVTKTIVFVGEHSRHGSACAACWGNRVDCNKSRIGQCAEALDKSFK